MVASLSAIGYFLPIFAFVLVFVVVYAFLKKTKILEDNESVMLLISFILAAFFIVQVKLVDFVQFTSSWVAVIMIGLFFLTLVISMVPGDAAKIFVGKGDKPAKWFGWVLFVAMILFFLVSAGYIFDVAVNWPLVRNWVQSDWFGFVLLLIVGIVVAIKVKPKGN